MGLAAPALAVYQPVVVHPRLTQEIPRSPTDMEVSVDAPGAFLPTAP
jgi:hypothetical protein